MRSWIALIPILTLSVAQAENPPAPSLTPAASATRGVSLGNTAELAELEVQMAEGSYQSNPSSLNLEGLIMSYEKLITARCMPNLLRTLEYAGNPQDSLCLKTISQALKLDARNPVAICARDGIGAAGCKEGFSRQQVRRMVFTNRTDRPAPGELEVRLSTTGTQKEITAKAEELRSTFDGYRAKPSDENKRKIEQLFSRLMFLNCKVWHLGLVPGEEPAPTPTSRADPAMATLQATVSALKTKEIPAQEPERRQSPLIEEDIYAKKSKAANPGQVPVPDNTVFRRFRLLAPDCAAYIVETLKFNPDFYQAICQRDGFVSPACIDALRKARDAGRLTDKPSAKTGPRRKDGLDSF
jgi:hypothetical protein